MRAFAVCGLLLLAGLAVTANQKVVNVNFANVFSSAPAADAIEPAVELAHDSECGNPDETKVNVNLAYMMNDYEQACQMITSEAQLAAHCATRTFQAAPVQNAVKVVADISTMVGACRSNRADVETNFMACVKPGGLVELQVQMKNTGTGYWPKSNFNMELRVETDVYPYWQKHKLDLLEDTKEGEVATFGGILKAPMNTGVFDLQWTLTGACGDIKTAEQNAVSVNTRIEVTCSDGVFCNGMERFVNGKCVNAVRGACDDNFACTDDSCDEETQRCTRMISDTPACSTVPACGGSDGEDCTPDCNGKTCGGDGCGGVCGSLGGLCADQESCNAGVCEVWSAPGSCTNAYQLLNQDKQFVATHVNDLDTSLGFQTSILTCNPTATSGQIMYTFTTPNDGETYSVDLRVSNGLAADSTLDTVLELREGECYDGIVPWELTGAHQNVWCSDDAVPPGGVGSRVVTELKSNQKYYVIVGGYSEVTVGPCQLSATFTKGYTPQCLSRYCGSDSGGGSCGTCPTGTMCDEYLHCSPAPTAAFCTTERCNSGQRECGSDGCGGFCGPRVNGTCPTGQLCQLADGVCGEYPICNHNVPVCTGCTENQFCGPDCECHYADEKLGDLVVDVDRFAESVIIDEQYFDEFTCAYHEKCVGGTGNRKLLRFDTTTINQGVANLMLGDPTRKPNEFSFAECHNHFHFSGYAAYRLLDDAGNVVGKGHKQGYCMEDSNRVARAMDPAHPDIMTPYLQGPDVYCIGVTTCEEPGISMGWTDSYGPSIDCQWVDITDVPAGEYWLEIELNVERRFLEATNENNAAAIRVTIPETVSTR